MITAKEARNLRNLANKRSQVTQTEREIGDFLNRVVQVANLGHDSFIHRPEEPLSKEVLEEIQELGYNIKEEGWKYVVNWR